MKTLIFLTLATLSFPTASYALTQEEFDKLTPETITSDLVPDEAMIAAPGYYLIALQNQAGLFRIVCTFLPKDHKNCLLAKVVHNAAMKELSRRQLVENAMFLIQQQLAKTKDFRYATQTLKAIGTNMDMYRAYPELFLNVQVLK